MVVVLGPHDFWRQHMQVISRDPMKRPRSTVKVDNGGIPGAGAIGYGGNGGGAGGEGGGGE